MKQFLQQMHDLIVEEALDKGTNRETKVVNFEHPAELQVYILEMLNMGSLTYASHLFIYFDINSQTTTS